MIVIVLSVYASVYNYNFYAKKITHKCVNLWSIR